LRSKIWEESFRGTTQTGLTDAEGEEIAHRLHAQNTAREEDRSAKILRQYFLDRAGSEHDPKTFGREAARCAESNPGPSADT